MAISLANKSALVTGSAGGLGKAIATAFLKAGASVTICDINSDRLSSAQAELSALGPVHIVKTDVSSESSVQALVNSAVGKFGGLDIVVNNAGMMDRFDPVGTLEKELWDRVLGVNLTGVYLVSKHAVNAMLAKEGEGPKGVVLNISSLGGISGAKAGAAYTASKHGVIGLTKNTAVSYGKKGIRCNAILPGGMETNIGEGLFVDGKPVMNQEGYQNMMMTAVMDPGTSPLSDMADLAAFLCSDQAVVLNGATISADKGWAAY